jgi:putative DNA methylase
MRKDRRLIEDYLPIQAISKEASREKSVRKGHISTLHLWWARRPLVACRAAVYGALVPAARFIPDNGPDNKKQSLGRANAAKFIERLCKYPGNPTVIKEAQRHIIEAHAERLTRETGKKVTVEDIEEGRAPRPKVLDMFAGGGAIPLEALRLGCEAYALDLNPVAHIIELCTLVYPQKYGKPYSNARGMTGPKNEKGETTWGGLANEVRYWGKWVLEKAREEIGDLYPPVPDPEYKGERPQIEFKEGRWVEKGERPNEIEEWAGNNGLPTGYLTPVAYLWTRTVQCKNPSCGATVPLVKQTWLCKKKGHYVALKTVAPKRVKKVHFEVVEATTEKGLGFDPAAGSEGGNATCPFCGTVADAEYVQTAGKTDSVGKDLMTVVCVQPNIRGKRYIASSDLSQHDLPDSDVIKGRIDELCRQTGLTRPEEPISPTRPSPNARGLSAVTRHGMATFRELFSDRQLLCLLTFCKAIIDAPWKSTTDGDRAKAVSSYLAGMVDKIADYGCTFCQWLKETEAVAHTFARHALAMKWDFAELFPFATAGSNAQAILESQIDAIMSIDMSTYAAWVWRGSATALPADLRDLDAVITDPPYYDNVPYADVSDFFYVWLKRSIGNLYLEHFSSELTPKKSEATALSSRHEGNMSRATLGYERMMLESFRQAWRALKADGQLIVVYAHKTTLGWSTLVDALRKSAFTVVEAWPLDTERGARLLAIDTASLASSIFLIARKREASVSGAYEDEVRPELEQIVRERVESLWKAGITGADLVIAAVGAGLRAFTRFSRVEYANGEEVPADKFLAEVEGVVLETILRRLSKEVGGHGSQFGLEGLDPATRFYVLWRYTYKYTVLDAGEAIIFSNGTHVELDGPNGLAGGGRALLEKLKGKYKLKDFSDRGDDKKLGVMKENGQPAPMIDALHRSLWLMEKHPGELPGFLQEAQPNREQMRLVAQVLAGPALKGGELAEVSPHAELSALGKLTANWRSVIEDSGLSPAQKKAKDRGQDRLF